MNYDPSKRIRYQVPTMIVCMSLGGLLMIGEGNKRGSTFAVVIGCMAIGAAAYFAFQWLQIKTQAWRAPNRKNK